MVSELTVSGAENIHVARGVQKDSRSGMDVERNMQKKSSRKMHAERFI